jgi:hypothetical protein
MILIIRKITDAMVAETRLPHRRSRFQTKRESSFNELHSPLQRNLRRKRQPVHVIRHDDEFMQKIFPFISIVSQGIDQKTGDGVAPENWLEKIATSLSALAKSARACPERSRRAAVAT